MPKPNNEERDCVMALQVEFMWGLDDYVAFSSKI